MVPESCDDSMNRSSSQQHHLQHMLSHMQEMKNIVTGQTTINKGDNTKILSKDFFLEGKIGNIRLFLNPAGSPGKHLFHKRCFQIQVFTYLLLNIVTILYILLRFQSFMLRKMCTLLK